MDQNETTVPAEEVISDTSVVSPASAEPEKDETPEVPNNEPVIEAPAVTSVPEQVTPQPATADGYQEADVFQWANNLVQYKDELKIDLFLVNKRGIVYRAKFDKALAKQMEPIFIDGLLEYVLGGAAEGLIVRGFEEGEAEDNVLQRVRVSKVEKAAEVLSWLKTQEHEIELFIEEEHDIKRIKGVVARVSHASLKDPFYVVKVLPQAQVLKGSQSWMVRDGRFVEFDADAALRIPPDNQLLIIDQDIFVFNQAKLQQMFSYNAKAHTLAEKKVHEIAQQFNLSFDENLSFQAMVQGNKSLVNKLQKLELSNLKQEELMDHAEELGLSLMQDESGAIIIMDEKDLKMFINLLNDDYVESNLTGMRYEIQRKKELKPPEEPTV